VKAVFGKPLTTNVGVKDPGTVVGQANIKYSPAPSIFVYVLDLLIDSWYPGRTEAPVKFLIVESVQSVATKDADPGFVVKFGLPIELRSILPQNMLFIQTNCVLELTVDVPSDTDIEKVFV
jgi:hypothetical protein